MKNHFSISLFALALWFVSSCGTDDEPDFQDASSATLTIDGTQYTKSANQVVSFSHSSFSGIEIFNIGGTVPHGGDTISFSLNLPSFNIATHTKEETGDDAELNIYFEDFFITYSSNPLIFENAEDITDYTIHITSSEDKVISGTFSGTLMNSNEQTIEVHGDFIAIDALSTLSSTN